MRPAVEARDLVHVYGNEPALSLDHLALGAGTWHLAGPNGAGKTTLLRILATLTRPTRGHVTVAGHPLPDEASQARAGLGYAGHEPSLHAALSARQALQVHADLHEVPTEHVGEALDRWALAEEAGRRVSQLSFGQRRRVDLARALLHEPDVVLLDEPTRGLDQPARDTLARRLQQLSPELVLVAAPEAAPFPVDDRLELADGRLREASA